MTIAKTSSQGPCDQAAGKKPQVPIRLRSGQTLHSAYAPVRMNNGPGDRSGGKRDALVVRQISRLLTSLAPWTGGPCSRTFAYMG